jgi:hypothetical protein
MTRSRQVDGIFMTRAQIQTQQQSQPHAQNRFLWLHFNLANGGAQRWLF